MAFINSCNTEQLKLLKNGIIYYLKIKKERFGPSLENDFISIMDYAIDERLGLFPDGRVVEGKFTYSEGNHPWSEAIFKTVSGEKINVSLNSDYLRPYYEYLENYKDSVRLYLLTEMNGKWGVAKLELLSDNNPPITPTVEKKGPVNNKFAREFIQNVIRDDAKGRRFVRDALASLERNELLLLRKIIFDDLWYSSLGGKIVPREPSEGYFIADRALYLIDERLDIPRYDYILEGRFVKSINFDGAIRYLFQSVKGNAFKVRLTEYAIVPLGYKVSFDEDIRLFINSSAAKTAIYPASDVIKIEHLDGTGY